MFYLSRCYQPHLTLFSESKDVPVEMAHSIPKKYSTKIELAARERAGTSTKDEVLRKVDDDEVPKSFLGLRQIYSDMTAACFKYNVVLAYPVHLVWLSLNAKQKRYLSAHGHTLLGFLPIGSGR